MHYRGFRICCFTNMVQLVKHMLATILGREFREFGCGTCSLAPKPKPDQNPRPLIMRLLNYRDRDKILQLNYIRIFSTRICSLLPGFTRGGRT